MAASLVVAAVTGAPARAAPAPGGWGALPISFEPNRGQTDAPVDFIARGGDGTGFLVGGALTLRFDRCAAASRPRARPHGCRGYAVRMSLAGARPRKAEGLRRLPGVASYFLGSDPSRWIAGIPTYAEVVYRDVLPGIDLRYHSFERHLELDMILAPSADPGRLRLVFDGADAVAVDARGDLQLTIADQKLTLRRPVAYQEIAGARRMVTSEYVVKGKRTAWIALGERDRSRPVVVDPVLAFSAQFGSAGEDGLEAVAVDATSGETYAAGYTVLTSFPTTPGVIYPNLRGLTDAVVLKLNATGTNLVYSTHLGGAAGNDHAYGIGFDASGNAIVTGDTTSTDFPPVAAFQSTIGGGGDAFVTKLNESGTALLYSTYAGGIQDEHGAALAVDSGGVAYVTGNTHSSAWAMTGNPFQGTFGGGTADAFLLKVSAVGNRTYASFFGGNGDDLAQGISLNGSDMFVAGETNSTNFPGTTSAASGVDAFVFKLRDPGGPTNLAFSRLIGGSLVDSATCVALDPFGGLVIIAGQTSSANFPTPGGTFENMLKGSTDAFLTAYDASGNLYYSTFLGGNGTETALACSSSRASRAWVVGRTDSQDFPTTPTAHQLNRGGGDDAFITEHNLSSAAQVYSTYLGGSQNDRATGVAIDGNWNVYVAGRSGLTFPITGGSYNNGGHVAPDSFVAKLRDVPPVLSSLSPDAGPTTGGTVVTFAGSNFIPNMSATFGGTQVTANYDSATSMTATTPVHAEGAVLVRVRYPDGAQSNALTFLYVATDGGGGGTDGGTTDGGEGTDGGGTADGGGTDGGGSGQVDLLGCSCASGAAGPAAFAIAAMAVLAARARQRRRPTSTPPSQ